MKKTTKFIFGAFLLSGITVTSYLNFSSSTQEIESYIPREIFSNSSNKASTPALELYEELRRNVVTGKMEASDFSNAWNSMKSLQQTSRGTILSLKEEGPDNVGGRTRAILVDKDDKNIVYAGSVSGGLFKSTNRGNTWSRVSAFSTVLSICSIAQTKDGTIYVGTGGGTPESSIATGGSGGHGAAGIYYTTDGGANFSKLTPASWDGKNIDAIVADPNSQDVIYVGGIGGAPSSSIRLTKIENKTTYTQNSVVVGGVTDLKISKDGNVLVIATGARTYVKIGNTTTRVSGNASGQIKESGISRIEYAISHEKNSAGKYSIYASMIGSGGRLGGVAASHDNGLTWSEIIPGTPTSASASTVLTTDPFANSAQFQGNYDNIITVLPGKPKEFLIAGINIFKWKESSTSAPYGQMAQFTSSQLSATNSLYSHADHHELVWDNSNRLYVGNDGGIGISDNAHTGASPVFYPANRGYNVTQFYGIGYSKYGDIVGGAQDNGTLYKEIGNPGTSLLEFKDANHSDGFDCEISNLNEKVIISSRQNLNVDRSSSKAGSGFHSTILSTEIIELTSIEKPFYTVLSLYENINDTNSSDSLLYYATEDRSIGDTLMITSQNLNVVFPHILTAPLNVTIDTAVSSTNDTTFSYSYRDTLKIQDKPQTLLAVGGQGSGGLWVTRGALRFGSTPIWWKVMNSVSGRVTELEFSKDGDILYVAQSGGVVTRIKGFNNVYFNSFAKDSIAGNRNNDSTSYKYADIRSGESQLEITNIFTGQYVTGMGVDPNDPEHLVITLGGYGASTNIMRSTAAASTTSTSSFTTIKGNMPAMPVYDAIIDVTDPTIIIAGTEFGVLVSQNSGGTWTAQNDEMGVVPVYDVRQQYRSLDECTNSGIVYFGTHGRGIWSTSDLYTGLNEINDNKEDAEISTINLYPNPAYNFTNIQLDLTKPADVTISVYSITGKLISREKLANRQSGELKYTINTNDLTKGIYFVNVQAEGMKFKAAKFIKQ